MTESRSPVSRLFGAVVPRAVDAVDPEQLLERIDVNALLGRIDIDLLLDRIDVDRLLDRVDVNALLERVDIDALMGRVDVDALIARVDVKAVVARAGIDEIVAETTSGLADRTIDLARRQVLVADLVVNAATDRILRRRHATAADDRQPAGPVSRLLAFMVDSFAMATSFGVLASVLAFLSSKFFGTTFDASGRGEPSWVILYFAWAFLYWWVSLEVAGRTPGKTLLGLRVTAVGGSLTASRVAVRTLLLPLVFVGVGVLPSLWRRDRRGLHDLAAGSQQIVDWGGRQARLPNAVQDWIDRRQPQRSTA
jgi:uncharacterized RDD family membrane protein YckC